MSRAKFQVAKELIQEKKYAEARTILKSIEDPKAEEWLRKLDRIDKKSSKGPSTVLLGVILLFLLILSGVVLTLRNSSNNNAAGIPQGSVTTITSAVLEETTPISIPTLILTQTPRLLLTETASLETIRVIVHTYCMRGAPDTAFCDLLVDSILTNSEARVQNCSQLFGNSLEDFGTCIHTEYATAYNGLIKPFVHLIAVSACTTRPTSVGVSDQGNTEQACLEAAERAVQRNRALADECFDRFMSWSVIHNLTERQKNINTLNLGLCVFDTGTLLLEN